MAVAGVVEKRPCPPPGPWRDPAGTLASHHRGLRGVIIRTDPIRPIPGSCRSPGIPPSPMRFFLRLLLATTILHPLEGITAGDWARVLRRERFRVSIRWWPRALWITALSLGNSIAARACRGDGSAGRSRRRRVDRPVFILGHYRSGTTHLPRVAGPRPSRFASPDRFQAFNPRAFPLDRAMAQAAGRAVHASRAGSRRTRSG